jgi:murein DD-endopeptidase MepM/ murein hydrolase activator NlpD
MSSWMYLLKVSAAFSLFYGLYWIAYRNKTFHRINRMLLLAILIVPLLIPFLELPENNTALAQTHTVFEWHMDKYIEGFSDTLNQSSEPSLCGTIIIKLFYVLGVLFFSFRFTIYLWKLIKIRRHSKAHKHRNHILIYTHNNLPPFSFFNWIFLPEDEFKGAYQHPIIEHERTHVRQGHTFDLLFAELFSIFLWFVPFVYSFKNAIKSVHEYLADSETLKQEFSPAEYLQLLAQNTEKYTLIGLSHNFYCKTLKNRISMITKIKSSKLSLWNYLLIIPTLALITLTCSNSENTDALASNNTEHETIAFQKLLSTQSPEFSLPIQKNQYKVSSPFGMRMHPTKKKEIIHNGIDLKAERETPVMAIADGTVIKKEFMKDTYGNVVVIEHSNGFVSLYAQLDVFKTELGTIVKKGDEIGLAGSSGLSTGPHLHLEIRKDGAFVNPADYLPPLEE